MKLIYSIFGWTGYMAAIALATPWQQEWKDEWKGDPWTVFVQGNRQTIIHAKTVWEWAHVRHRHSIDRTAQEAFGELYDTLPFNSSQYLPPFKLDLHNYLKIDGLYVFIAPPISAYYTEAPVEPPDYAWVVMNAEGHVLWAFHWYYSSSYEFPWIKAIHDRRRALDIWRLQTRKNTVDYDEYYNRKPEGLPISLQIRSRDRVVYALDAHTQQYKQLYIFSKGACALAVYSLARMNTLDWDFNAWEQHLYQTQEELELLEQVLGKFIDIQMNSSSKPQSYQREIEAILPRAGQLASQFHLQQTTRKKNIESVYDYFSKVFGQIFPTFEPDYISPLSPVRDEDRREFLRELNLPLNRFHPNAWIDVTCQVSYCTERWIKKIWKGYLKVDEPNKCQKRSFLCTLMPESRGRTVSIAYAISEYASENLCREALADRRFWRPFNEPKESLQDTLRHTRINPGLVGEYDLTSTLRMNYRGVIIPESDTSSIIFRRGNTVVALIASDPNYSVLPLAKKIDQALKNIYEPEP